MESSDSASDSCERHITNSKSKSFAFDMCLLRHDPSILIPILKAQIKLHESLSPSRYHTLCRKDESLVSTSLPSIQFLILCMKSFHSRQMEVESMTQIFEFVNLSTEHGVIQLCYGSGERNITNSKSQSLLSMHASCDMIPPY
ncbi:hypothetical protein CDAR_547821 [Caerostris darwini]|uniref:Uncharacterized protein n=1 Tax=Caerostris darwini TaxID=1538125 RepID=A0AAV4WGP3_9ARAC|nr:hypothetical protein CDAR_547821 [Caerostris darwini]